MTHSTAHHAKHRAAHHHPAHRQPNHVDAFIKLQVADARAVSLKTGVPVSVILAQSGLESGWGLRMKGNAYFGVKGHAPDGGTTKFVTHEVVKGQRKQVTDSFRDYANYGEAAEDYAEMLQRRFPQAFADNSDSMKFVTHLHRYATVGDYVERVQGVIRGHNLQQYDVKP
ncbi:glucosaminidase domain-containing protein [Dyella sp.]|uniref:glycoside hydrolase family 73 protein n=1 Tax=Dyella sp. TaxID=1869338 RepID=UPI002FD991B1